MFSLINIESPSTSKTVIITELGFSLVPRLAGVGSGVATTTRLANISEEKCEDLFCKSTLSEMKVHDLKRKDRKVLRIREMM